MQLIDQVEIAYFRSLYKDSISQCADTNIIFGRNDSGKSNILRALNLFFNNNTSPDQDFVFTQDFNHSRRAEAGGDGDIRKFVYIKIWFNTPRSWQSSLGKKFWVKKQWSVSAGSDSQLSCSIEEKKRHYMSRFLNKIRLYYIPAIKDRKIFESLQAEIYTVISQNAEFSVSLEDFSNALRDRTLGLSQQLFNDLNIASVVTTPKDLTDLFRSLDFETTSEAGDAYSLTLQRGDGVQVRHIAPILSFLAENSSEDFHIWAFEEPENSLELANAIEEAKRFRAFGLESNKQIFLTSHSPAFFSLDHEDIKRYYVSRTKTIEDRLNSTIIDIDSHHLPSELMGETPHLPVVSAYLRDAHAQITAQAAANLELEQKLDAHSQSIVFVEGESDVLILNKAWEVLMQEDRPFRFESCGGTSKMEGLSKDGKVLSNLAPGRKVFALVDNDTEGRSLYSNGKLKTKGRWVRHNSNNVYWCRLPFNEGFERHMKYIGLPDKMWPGSLENLFDPSLKQRAVEAGALRVKDCPHAEVIDQEHFGRIRPYLQPREDLLHFYLLANDEDTKISFAEWVVRISDDEPEIFEPLRVVFDGLLECMEHD